MLTSSIDVAQVILYAFWAFFFGLIYWLRLEDRREGYPLETDNPRFVYNESQLLIPAPKTFKVDDDHEVQAPNFARDGRELLAERTAESDGSPHDPVGDPMLSNVGPATYAQRHDVPEVTLDGRDLIVPMRADASLSMLAGPDPRGWEVVAGDGQVAGTVKELWVDRADVLVRYLEVQVTEGSTCLVPMPMAKLRASREKVEVSSIFAKHFAQVPALKNPDQVTVLEEEKISAFYAGGLLYAEPRRMEPAL